MPSLNHSSAVNQASPESEPGGQGPLSAAHATPLEPLRTPKGLPPEELEAFAVKPIRSKYVVIDEDALGYAIERLDPDWYGVLAAKLDSLHPADRGPTHAAPGPHTTLRPATTEDFARFRVCVPPDFGSKH
jgi:hypothetical protein